MPSPHFDSAPITDMANRWSAREPGATRDQALFDAIYERLHEIAQAQLARYPRDPLLQTTMILNEAFLKLARGGGTRWRDREHFFAYCSRAMRHVLVDLARRRTRSKRGGGTVHLTLDAQYEVSDQRPNEDVLAVHAALGLLERIDPDRARIVELRYFGGMEPREIGRAIGLSESTVHRRWRVARAWLYDQLTEGSAAPSHRRRDSTMG